MKYTLSFIVAVLLLSSCMTAQPPDYSPLQAKYSEKLSTYLLKEESLKEYIIINNQAVFIFDTSDRIEFELLWEDVPLFQEMMKAAPAKARAWYDNGEKPTDYQPKEREPFVYDSLSSKPLAGLKIALDPGHIAGDIDMAVFEGKNIKMNMPSDKKDIEFFESELNWHTTKYLEKKLIALGAEVFLSRNAMDHTAFGMSYNDWYAKADTFPKPPKRRFFFSYFRHIENDERVRIINEFEPDLSLVIHYNVDGTNKNWKKPTDENFSMAFVGGGYMKNELNEKERRFHLLRLLLTEDVENSIQFSKQVLDMLEDSLNIPPIPLESSQTYLKYNSIATEHTGVYARNLSLSSRIQSPLCYAEPLFQDAETEVHRLNTKDYNFDGIMIPTRVTEVADAYLDAIMLYVKEKY